MTIQSQTQIINAGNAKEDKTVLSSKIIRLKTPKTTVARRLLSNTTHIEDVRKMIKRQELITPQDFYFASIVLEKGSDPEDHAMAYLAAFHANNLGYVNAPNTPHSLVVAASARDKWLIAMGQPQDFGTQRKSHPCGLVERYPTNPNISEAERLRFHVPRLTWISR